MEIAMKKMTLWIIAVAMLSESTLYAQDIAGDWQGTLKKPFSLVSTSVVTQNRPMRVT